MASPLSFGDAYQISKLALQLGKAFTKGRKSAPAEFREVENQLYSLSLALQAFRVESQDPRVAVPIPASALPRLSSVRDGDDRDVLSQVVDSCASTLRHLESIVEKYSIIGRAKDEEPARLRFRRWNDNLRHTWKTIWWTTEGGDLANLRSKLMIHTNSLSLLLGTIQSSQTGRIEAMLTEMHTWFTENLLQGSSTAIQSPAQEQSAAAPEPEFELHVDAGAAYRLVCSHATISSGSLLSVEDYETHRALFECRCPIINTGGSSHRDEVSGFALSPISFCARVAGSERVLMVYKTTDAVTSTLKSLLLKRFSRSGVSDIEEFFLQILAFNRAKLLISRNMSNMMCYVSGVESNNLQAHVLNLMVDAKAFRSSAQSVTFTSELQSYARENIRSIQILHYKNTDLGASAEPPYPTFQFDDTAEIILFYEPANSVPHSGNTDIVRTTCHLKSNTKLKSDTSQAAVVLEEIDCTGYTASEEVHTTTGVEVKICFVDTASALAFKKQVEYMQTELFVLGLQYPRPFERRVLNVQARNVHTEHLLIADAEISIMRNSGTGRFRLVMASRDGYSILSHELAENFFETLTSGTRPTFNSLTYVVILDDAGKRIIKTYPRGFHLLDFKDANVERMFQLGLATLEGTTGGALQHRPALVGQSAQEDEHSQPIASSDASS